MKDKIISIIKQNWKIIILIICMITFIAIAEDILENEIWDFDEKIYSGISKIMSEPVTSVLKVVTNLGGALAIISITAIILLVFKNKKYGLYTVLNLLIITPANQLLKYIIQRPRPTEYRIINESGFSFPSGHSMVSMAFYGFLIYLVYHNVKNKYLKCSLCIGLSMLILTIGLSRIYLGVHYASDVIGGFTLSIAYLILYTKIVGKNIKNN